MSKKMLIVTGLIALLLGAAIVWAVQTYVFPNTATLGTVELTFWLDTDPITSTEEISWGNVTYDSTYYYNFTVKNTGSARCLVIMSLSDFPSDWTLTWTGNETLLDPDEVVSADLELTTPISGTATTYEWDIIVTGEEV